MGSNSIRRALPLIVIVTLLTVAIVYLNSVTQSDDGPLTASGTVEATEVTVVSEVAGRVVEVLVAEGDYVEQGTMLIILDDELVQTQKEQVLAAIETAEAALNTSRANLKVAQVQYELVRQEARLGERSSRLETWRLLTPGEFSLPIWYFDKGEEIAAAEAELEFAEKAMEIERANLIIVLNDATYADLVETEVRLANARAAFLVAEEVWDRARRAREDEKLEDLAEEYLEAAEDELEAAQSDYEQLLSEETTEVVLEARARVAVAQARYDAALDRLSMMWTGDDSLSLRISELVVAQAEAVVAQSEAALAQAQAELGVIELQQAKFVLHAPVSGIVASCSIEQGEVLWAGASALTLYQLEHLTLTVYVSENRYGQINIGEQAIVKADSFPGESFAATVIRIADRAEYTPRNVQTEEGRRSTVFAVELSVTDPAGRLKPGMPADVDFGE